MTARVVDHVLEQLGRTGDPVWRELVASVVAHTVAYLDEHPARVDWCDDDPTSANSRVAAD